ncbi:MAG TPA: hypothetical protein PLH94_14855 [Fimbriimonadaceae bacterium]|nr:hypothetical protein [Fimbriimonadaceae bacterium]
MILEYFDYDLREGVPDTSTQVANTLVAEVMFEQPSLTEFIWLPIGSVAFYIDPGPFDTVTQYYAETPSSARADSELFLFYQLTKEGETTTVMCTSTKYWGSLKNGANAPNYKAVTCHRPQTVVPVGSFNIQPRVQNPPYSYGDNHVLQLWSQLDPFKDVLLQERFPNGIPTTFDASSIPITFAWNGSTGSVWTTGVSGLCGNLGPFNTHEPGYKYHGKFADTLMMSGWPGPDRPFSGGQTVLSFFHRYHAATSSTSSGSFSVPLESFWGRLWTDLTTHVP